MFALSVEDLEVDRNGYDEQFDRLIKSRRVFEHPSQVLADDALSSMDKRAILSAWASDAHAVESAPPLRRPPFAARAVSIDEVMAALRQLDRTALGRTARRATQDHGTPDQIAA
ncbi:MAG: hypothetical protein ACOVVK_14520 [Elsteraceae bacterium]